MNRAQQVLLMLPANLVEIRKELRVTTKVVNAALSYLAQKGLAVKTGSHRPAVWRAVRAIPVVKTKSGSGQIAGPCFHRGMKWGSRA